MMIGHVRKPASHPYPARLLLLIAKSFTALGAVMIILGLVPGLQISRETHDCFAHALSFSPGHCEPEWADPYSTSVFREYPIMFAFVIALIAPAALVWKDPRWRMVVIWPWTSLLLSAVCIAIWISGVNMFSTDRVVELWPAQLLRHLLWVAGFGVATLLPFGSIGALWSWDQRRRAAKPETSSQLPTARARLEGMRQ